MASERRLTRIDPWPLLAIVGPVAVVLALLLPFVDADPVAGVTSSNSPFTDEAWSVLNARNWAFFGTPATDQWTLHLVTLPFTVIEALVFRVFGVGIVQARLVDVGCVALTTGLLAGGLRRPFGAPAAFVAAMTYGTSALVLFYGRMAYLEPMAGLFLTAGTLTITAVDGARPGRWGLVGGVMLALAVGTKLTALPGVVGVLGVMGLVAVRAPAARRWVAAAGGTLAAGAGAWTVAVWLPNQDAVANILQRIYPQAGERTPGLIVRRLLEYPLGHDDHAIGDTAPLLAGAAAGLAAGALGFRSLSTGARLVLGASLAGFVVGLAFTVGAIGGANRYVVLLLPWLAILTAPLTAAVTRLADRRLARLGAPRVRPGALAAVTLAALFAAQGVTLHLAWMRDARHELVAAQAAVARELPEGVTVAGGYAALLAMTARVHAILPCCGDDPVNAGDLYLEAGARYWVDFSPPGWSGLHADAWAARQATVCLTWHRTAGRLCLERLP